MSRLVRRNYQRGSIAALGLFMAGLTTGPAWAVLNNGFQTDYLYAVQTAWKDDMPDAGDVLMFDEHTAAYAGKLIDFVADPDPSKQDWGWEVITFAYDGNGNARLFVARRMDRNPADALSDETYRDIEIAEYNAGGGLIKKVQLADTFLGTNHLGDRVRVGCIRFSSYPGHSNSLFVAVLAQSSQYQPCKIYEVDLDLTTLKNVYTGPSATDSAPRIDFNPTTGRMYVVACALNEPTQVLGRADLVAFNYAPPGTNPSTYSTLINGKVFARRDDKDTLTDPGSPISREKVSIWYKPIAVIYRGTDHEDGRETLLIPSDWNSDATRMPCNEFFLDQADSEGNLVRRGTFYNDNYSVSNGQLDRLTGHIWLARLYGFNSNAGFVRYDKNDRTYDTGIGANRGFSDVCSPGLAPMGAGWISANGSVVVNGNASVPIAQMPGTRIGFEDHPNIHANSYHLDVTEVFANELDPVVAQGQAEDKPVIVSDDNSSSSNATRVQEAIARTTSVLGEHYEHYDFHLRGDTGEFVSSVDDFPAESKAILTTLGTYASHLTPWGRLTVSGHEFLWNGQPVTLAGSGFMGAMVAKMCDVDGYLDVLESYGANLIRVWAIEQWAATAQHAPGFERAGWLIFDGYKEPNTSLSPPETKWDLHSLNAQYFARVREFVRKAAARGIVVQLSVFDRFGVQCQNQIGFYIDSPYYDPNNLASTSFLNCSNGFLPLLDLAPAPIWDVNQAYLQRLVAELRGYGNIIYEIMNEPHNQWPKTTIINWHKAVADTLVAAGTPPGLQASVDLGDPDVIHGLTPVQVPDGDTMPTTVAGRTCRTSVDPATDRHFYFRLDPALNGTRPELFITVDYYDSGGGSLMLQYDSTDSAPFPNDIYKSAAPGVFTGSGAWKSQTFHIADARFAHRQNGGADFRILRSQAEALSLDTVMVRELGVVQPPASTLLRRGETAHFTIIPGGGGPFTYQWQHNGADLIEGGNVSGSRSQTVQIANAAPEDEGSYWCILSSAGVSVISAAASLTLAAPGDYDLDGDVDQSDFGEFQQCFAGNNAFPAGCDWADLNADGRVNASDFAIFMSCMNGPGLAPGC